MREPAAIAESLSGMSEIIAQRSIITTSDCLDLPQLKVTTSLAAVERFCPGIAEQLYVPVGSALSDAEAPIFYVAAETFAELLNQLAVGAMQMDSADEDYPMEDATESDA